MRRHTATQIPSVYISLSLDHKRTPTHLSLSHTQEGIFGSLRAYNLGSCGIVESFSELVFVFAMLASRLARRVCSSNVAQKFSVAVRYHEYGDPLKVLK
jgi:hypothetical protein